MLDPIRFRGLERRTMLGRVVPVAATFPSRVLGLSRLDRDCAGQGLLIPRCRSVHTFGMRFSLDLLFFDDEGRVIDLRRQVPPRRIARNPAAAAILELPSP
jgi:uncharacterized membrane protein (UPF0127 family)